MLVSVIAQVFAIMIILKRKTGFRSPTQMVSGLAENRDHSFSLRAAYYATSCWSNTNKKENKIPAIVSRLFEYRCEKGGKEGVGEEKIATWPTTTIASNHANLHTFM